VKWVAATPGLMNATASSTIVGMSRPEHVDQTLELAGVRIPDELWDEMLDLTAPESACCTDRPIGEMVNADPTSFGIIGSGWRTEFLLRLARMAPDRFRAAGVVTRTAKRGAEVTARWQVLTFRSASELLDQTAPELVIVSTPWPATPDSIRELVRMHVHVLAETPPAPDLAGLQSLWADVGDSGLVQVAEQYLLMPEHAARLAIVRDGVIGQPTSVQVSSTHLYHAVSMIRGLLGVGCEPAVVNARSFTSPLVDPLTKEGWSGDSTPRNRTTTLATIDFGDGRTALYDFTDNQWWNPLRTRRIVIRGSLGEIVDDRLVRLVDPTTPVESHLIRRQTGIDLNLEGFDLDHISCDGRVVYRNPFVGARFSEDDLAVATLLDQAGAWARGEGPEPYPLREGMQDHLISLAIEESATTGRDAVTAKEAWAP
jgi:predicted dehydrogenase